MVQETFQALKPMPSVTTPPYISTNPSQTVPITRKQVFKLVSPQEPFKPPQTGIQTWSGMKSSRKSRKFSYG